MTLVWSGGIRRKHIDDAGGLVTSIGLSAAPSRVAPPADDDGDRATSARVHRARGSAMAGGARATVTRIEPAGARGSRLGRFKL